MPKYRMYFNVSNPDNDVIGDGVNAATVEAATPWEAFIIAVMECYNDGVGDPSPGYPDRRWSFAQTCAELHYDDTSTDNWVWQCLAYDDKGNDVEVVSPQTTIYRLRNKIADANAALTQLKTLLCPIDDDDRAGPAGLQEATKHLDFLRGYYESKLLNLRASETAMQEYYDGFVTAGRLESSDYSEAYQAARAATATKAVKVPKPRAKKSPPYSADDL